MVWILNNLLKTYILLSVMDLFIDFIYNLALSVSNGGPIGTEELGGVRNLSVAAQNCEGGWGELYNERLTNLCSPPNIIRLITSRRMR
jgi:hypothetical protein